METTATVKGQIVIPSAIRKKFGIKGGTRIRVEADEKSNTIVLRPITRESIMGLMGKYKGRGMLKVLMDERKRERELP